MYRNGTDYDKLDELIYSIYIDYDIKEFPIDEKELCQKMQIDLVPYSALSDEAKKTVAKEIKTRIFCQRVQGKLTNNLLQR